MTLSLFLDKIYNHHDVGFDETIAIINEYYYYQPTEFSNGVEPNKIINKAGSNEGSCRIFAFAKLHGLNPEQTLNLFGDFYRQDVLNHPQDDNHPNIRQFMRSGWDGIQFKGVALTPKS